MVAERAPSSDSLSLAQRLDFQAEAGRPCSETAHVWCRLLTVLVLLAPFALAAHRLPRRRGHLPVEAGRHLLRTAEVPPDDAGRGGRPQKTGDAGGRAEKERDGKEHAVATSGMRSGPIVPKNMHHTARHARHSAAATSPPSSTTTTSTSSRSAASSTSTSSTAPRTSSNTTRTSSTATATATATTTWTTSATTATRSHPTSTTSTAARTTRTEAALDDKKDDGRLQSAGDKGRTAEKEKDGKEYAVAASGAHAGHVVPKNMLHKARQARHRLAATSSSTSTSSHAIASSTSASRTTTRPVSTAAATVTATTTWTGSATTATRSHTTRTSSTSTASRTNTAKARSDDTKKDGRVHSAGDKGQRAEKKKDGKEYAVAAYGVHSRQIVPKHMLHTAHHARHPVVGTSAPSSTTTASSRAAESSTSTSSVATRTSSTATATATATTTETTSATTATRSSSTGTSSTTVRTTTAPRTTTLIHCSDCDTHDGPAVAVDVARPSSKAFTCMRPPCDQRVAQQGARTSAGSSARTARTTYSTTAARTTTGTAVTSTSTASIAASSATASSSTGSPTARNATSTARAVSTSTTSGTTKSSTSRVLPLAHLLDGYHKELPPFFDSDEPLSVAVLVDFMSLNGINEVTGTISLILTLRLWWVDERLTVANDNMMGDELPLPADLVWTPDVTILNKVRVEHLHSNNDVILHSPAWLDEHGANVEWSRTLMVESSCAIDLAQFPFDNQSCALNVGSLAYTKDQLRLVKQTPRAFDSFATTEFEVSPDGITVEPYRNTAQMFSELSYAIRLHRHSHSYLIMYILPTLAVTLLTMATMWMDRGNMGQRINGATKLLLCIVSIVWLTGRTRPASDRDVWLDAFQSHCLAMGMSSVLQGLIVGYMLSTWGREAPTARYYPTPQFVDVQSRAVLTWVAVVLLSTDGHRLDRYRQMSWCVLCLTVSNSESAAILVGFVNFILLLLLVNSTCQALWELWKAAKAAHEYFRETAAAMGGRLEASPPGAMERVERLLEMQCRLLEERLVPQQVASVPVEAFVKQMLSSSTLPDSPRSHRSATFSSSCGFPDVSPAAL